MAPVAAAVGWFDNFNDGNISDGSPVTWSTNPAGALPGIYDASSGDLTLSNPGGGTNDSMVAWVNTNFTDVFVRTQAVVVPGPEPEQLGGTLGVVARFNPSTISGYVALLSNGAHLELLRVDGGVNITTLIELTGLPIDTAADAMIELNAVDDLLSVYLWRPEEPKPTEPIVVASDTMYPSGVAGVVHNENADAVQGVFRFAAAQDTPFSEALPGDFNNDGSVDAADYVLWRENPNSTFTPADYLTWRANFGRTAGSAAASLTGGGTSAVPEASSIALLLLGIASFAAPFSRSVSRYHSGR